VCIFVQVLWYHNLYWPHRPLLLDDTYINNTYKETWKLKNIYIFEAYIHYFWLCVFTHDWVRRWEECVAHRVVMMGHASGADADADAAAAAADAADVWPSQHHVNKRDVLLLLRVFCRVKRRAARKTCSWRGVRGRRWSPSVLLHHHQHQNHQHQQHQQHQRGPQTTRCGWTCRAPICGSASTKSARKWSLPRPEGIIRGRFWMIHHNPHPRHNKKTTTKKKVNILRQANHHPSFVVSFIIGTRLTALPNKTMLRPN